MYSRWLLICFCCQLHLHASTDAVLNVTFLRAPSNALLKVDVPLVFIGDDVSPGLKKGNNVIKTFLTHIPVFLIETLDIFVLDFVFLDILKVKF